MMPVAKKACISWRLKIKKRKEYQFRRHMKIKAVVEELKCLKEDLNSEVLNRVLTYAIIAYVGEPIT